MLRLRVKAPYAAFRTFTAGSYRPTAPFLTPSAAYGLALNVAAIETRRDDEGSPTTLMAFGLPPVQVAIGALEIPEVQTLYQQLHNYPVGASGKEREADAHGNKYNIQPIRRELLSGVDAYVCLDGNDELEQRVRQGLTEGARFGPAGRRRYGVPFLGDNNFMLSILREELKPEPAHWFSLVDREGASDAPNLCRLTVWIDRAAMSRTRALLYSRAEQKTLDPPSDAWTPIRPPAAPP